MESHPSANKPLNKVVHTNSLKHGSRTKREGVIFQKAAKKDVLEIIIDKQLS